MKQTQQDQNDYFFKITMAGSTSVGKSCIIYHFIKNTSHPDSQTTVGVQFCSKTLTVNDKTIKLGIWDTAGQDRFNAIAKMYYRNSAAVILVYDITDESTFEKAKTKLTEIRESVLIVLVGNKLDMEAERKVKKEQGVKFAKEQSIRFFEASAYDGTNIETIFKSIAEELCKLKQQELSRKSQTPNQKPNVNLEENNTLEKSTLEQLEKKRPKKPKEGGCC